MQEKLQFWSKKPKQCIEGDGEDMNERKQGTQMQECRQLKKQ